MSHTSDSEGSALAPVQALCRSDTDSSHEEAEAAGRRKGFQPYHSQSVPRSELQRTESKLVTTMMLRNIPNKYTQNTLLQEINELGFAETYNFFYLPMDVHNRSNVGYAFINFHQPEDAERFQEVFTDHRFQRFHSRKIGSVCKAHVQGLDENIRHFENRAVTQARNDQYRPIVIRGQQRVSFEEAVKLNARSIKLQSTLPTVMPEAPVSGPGFAPPLPSTQATLQELLALRAMMWQRLMATGYLQGPSAPKLAAEHNLAESLRDLNPMYVDCSTMA